MAKAGTSSNKKTTSKKVATKKVSTKKASTSKATTKKTAVASSKKKTTAKAVAAPAKKTTKKATTAATKKKSTKKPAVTKKTTSRKKTTSKKKVAGQTAQTEATSVDSAQAVAEETTTPAAKTKTRKRSTAAERAKRGMSVAEVANLEEADEDGYVFIHGRRIRKISTGGKVMSKKTKPASTEQTAEEDAPAKARKTKLTKKQLDHFRELLLAKRAEIVGDLTAMEAAALRANGGEISHMPIHMADIGTDTYEQDFTLSLAESERKQLREIDEALARIENRTYGVCEMTNEDIPLARLNAKPWAKYTIEAARIIESQQQQ